MTSQELAVAVADVVQDHVELMMSPFLERLAAAEARIAMLPAAEKSMTDLRDRVVAVETKASVPQQDAAIGELRERISALSEWRSVVTQLPAQVSALSDMVSKELADLRARLGAVETRDAPEPGVDLGPIGERVAAAEARLATLGDLRDRVVTVETKSSVPPAVPDLAPVLERVAATEARLSVLGDLRDRVVTVETKSAIPLAPDTAIGDLRDRLLTIETKAAAPTAVEHAVEDMKSRLTVLESREVVAPVVGGEDLRDRVVTLETRAAGPSVTDMAVVDLRERLGALERRVSDDKVTPEIAAIRERLAVAEVKAPVPGPAGKDGADGQHGKDGIDGMGWDDLSVAHDGERAFAIKMMRGDRVKDVGTFTLPVQIYRGVYTEGRTYEPGDTVTYARSLWHCHKTTVLKPDGVTRDSVTGEPKGSQGKDFWKMAVKGGQDGKDGRDGHDQRPVVSVGRNA